MQNQNSGGWRYGNGSNDFLYKNEGIDNELLKRAAAMTEAPKGLLDKAVQVNPLDKLMQQDKGYGSGGSGNGQSGPGGTVSGETGIGVGSMSNARDKAAGMAGLGAFAKSPGLLGGVMGVLAANNVIGQTNQSVLGHVNSMSDPIASLNAIQGWTTPDQDYLANGFGSSVAAGGGWASLSPGMQSAVANSPDPIGAFAAAIGMGSGLGNSSSNSGGNYSGPSNYGGATGGFQSSYGSGSVGGTGGGLGNSSSKSGGTGEGANGNAGNGRD